MTDATPGMRAMPGIGVAPYTIASYPWPATKRGNADAVRRPAAAAAMTKPHVTAISKLSTSHGRHCCRNCAVSTSRTARTTTSPSYSSGSRSGGKGDSNSRLARASPTARLFIADGNRYPAARQRKRKAAAANHLEALAIYTDCGRRPGQAEVLNSLGELFARIGDSVQARDHHALRGTSAATPADSRRT